MSSRRTMQAMEGILGNGKDTDGYESAGHESVVSEGTRNEAETDYPLASEASSEGGDAPGEVSVDTQMTGLGYSGPGEESRVLIAQELGIDPGNVRSSGKGEQRGRARVGGRSTLRGPAIPPPAVDWGPGRGHDLARSQIVASRGEGRRDVPSGSGGRFDLGLQQGRKRRRDESAHDQDREAKAMMLFDTSNRASQYWKSGGIQAQQQGGGDTITGINLLGGGRNGPNYIGQFVGGASDALAAKTTGRSHAALGCLVGAYSLAAGRSGTDEVLSTFTPIHRISNPMASTSERRVEGTTPAGQGYLRLPALKVKPKREKNRWAMSETSSLAPWMPTNAQRARDSVDQVTAPRTTAGAEDEAPAGDKGKQAEVVDLTEATEVTEAQGVDLTGLDDELTCDICHRVGSHSTGRCAVVTSLTHGDTTTDPFCDQSSGITRSRPGQQPHALQGPQKGKFRIACPVLDRHFQNYEVWIVWHTLVVERRRMPPLAVQTQDFCFVDLTIRWSQSMNGGKLPPEMDGIWPYTKADAVKYEKECNRFWEIGMENMPPGELKGLTMDEIRQAYRDGRLMSQIRWNAADTKKKALLPARVEYGNGPEKAAKQPGTVDGSGDTVMGDEPSVAGTSNSVAAATAELRAGADESDIVRSRLRAMEAGRRIRHKRQEMRMSAAEDTIDAERLRGAGGRIKNKGAATAGLSSATKEGANKEAPGAEDDLIGTITGPQDIPSLFWAEWTSARSQQQQNFNTALQELYLQIHDAGQPGVVQTTQTKVYNRLTVMRELGGWPAVMAKAWDDSIGDWEWVNSN